ncbi:MAG: phytanoyl-CoA dioxygenase family protein [Candidatus Latescibacteria bacterium]|nr:phytanoyl-CoA dioxygenase family protein [Candidatus Latescibacterota bacterium]
MAYQTTPETLSQAQIDHYRNNGFVHIPGIISPEETSEFHDAIQNFSENTRPNESDDIKVRDNPVFTQLVNFWPENETIRHLTFHPNIGALAEKLAGVPLRLWHDHVLIKQPHNETPTAYHQDQPFWPHNNSPCSISAWIALCDVPVERGCMTFIPGTHRYTDLPTQSTRDDNILFAAQPDLEWAPRITVPLKAGDCTFHHSRCAHMATPNSTDEPRVAHVIIFMDQTTTYSGKNHIVTDPLELEEGMLLDGELFPSISEFPSHINT